MAHSTGFALTRSRAAAENEEYMLSLAAVVFLSAIDPVHAADTPPLCDLLTLTNDCKMFDPSMEFVQLPSGNTVRNFSYEKSAPLVTPTVQEDKSNSQVKANDTNGMTEHQAQQLESKIEVMALLDKKGAALSEHFKMFFVDTFPMYWGYLASPSTSNASFSFYSPMNSETGKIQDKDIKSIKKELEQIFSKAEIEALVSAQQGGAYFGGPLMPLKDPTKPEHGHHKPAGKTAAEDPLTPKPMSAEHMKEMVEFTRAAVIAAIRQGRPDMAISASENEILAKIAAIEPYVASEFVESCTGSLPNAFYDPTSNKIGICPLTLEEADSSFTMTLGHEFGHAFDPCHGFSGMYRLNQEKFQNQTWLSEGTRRSWSNMKQISGNFLEYSVTDGKSLLKRLLEAGALTTVSGPIDPGNYPFRGIESCLISQAGGAFRSTQNRDQEQYFQEIENEGFPKRAVDAMREVAKKSPECMNIDGRASQLGEAFGDWFGTVASSAYLKANPVQVKSPDAVAKFLNLACSNRRKGETVSMIELNAQIDKVLLEEHPSYRHRLNSIMFANPSVANSLGCTATPGFCGYVPPPPTVPLPKGDSDAVQESN